MSKYRFDRVGMNIRPTETNAFVANKQLDRFSPIRRQINFGLYKQLLGDDVKTFSSHRDETTVPIDINFGFPILVDNRNQVANHLMSKGVECRPLIAGCLAEHPFAKHLNHNRLVNSKTVHHYGMYLPNHNEMGFDEIKYITDLIKESLN